MDGAQLVLGAPAHGHVGAQREARHRHPDHERQQQQERFVERVAVERPAAGERAPDRKAGQHQRGRSRCRAGRGAAPTTTAAARRGTRAARGAPPSAKSGLKAIRPIAQATQKMTINSNSLRRLERADVRRRPQHDHRRDQQARRRDRRATRSARPNRSCRALGEAARARGSSTPMVAHSAVGRKADQREAGNAGRAFEGGLAVRPAIDQVGAEQTLRSCCRRRWRARSQSSRRS